ncbi:MAG: DUF4292 domain-containing protein [Desulfuromonadales bacterium]|nr:DUF4292 domain-containing protein [Desulfuromonadales bacterium]
MKQGLLILLLLMAGCARPDSALRPLPTASELLESFARTQGLYRSLDGEARVGVTVADKFFSSQQFLLVDRPDRLRIDALSSFGQLLLQLAVDRDEMMVFLNTTVPGRYYRGAASDANLWRFTRLPIGLEQMLELLLYDPPLIASAALRVAHHPQGALLSLDGGSQRQEIVFDRRWRPVFISYFDRDQLSLQVGYEKFSEVSGFPSRIRIEIPGQKTSASVRFSEVRTNVAIPAERFSFVQPANTTLENLPE